MVAVWVRAVSVSGDEAQLAGVGDGLGAVGRAELVEDVADVLFDRSCVTTRSWAMSRLRWPAASSRSTSSSRSVRGSTSPAGTGMVSPAGAFAGGHAWMTWYRCSVAAPEPVAARPR